jgi:hypothetical protein
MNAKDALAIIEAGRTEDLLRIQLHDLIGAQLKRWDGKRLTARFITNLEKQNPDMVFWLDRQAHMWHVKVWGVLTEGAPSVKSGDALQFFIGYNSQTRFGDNDLNPYRFETFEDRDVANGSAARTRIDKRNDLIYRQAPQRIAHAINEYLSARETLKRALGDSIENPEYYAFEKAAGLD